MFCGMCLNSLYDTYGNRPRAPKDKMRSIESAEEAKKTYQLNSSLKNRCRTENGVFMSPKTLTRIGDNVPIRGMSPYRKVRPQTDYIEHPLSIPSPVRGQLGTPPALSPFREPLPGEGISPPRSPLRIVSISTPKIHISQTESQADEHEQEDYKQHSEPKESKAEEVNSAICNDLD